MDHDYLLISSPVNLIGFDNFPSLKFLKSLKVDLHKGRG